MSWRTRVVTKLLDFTWRTPTRWSHTLGSSSTARDGALPAQLALLGFGTACFSVASTNATQDELRKAGMLHCACNSVNNATPGELKKQAGYKAVDDYVKSGMVIGLGTGSTAYFAVERVAQHLKSGRLKGVIAIPTSIRTKEQAEGLGIPLATLDTHSKLDVAIDGADAVDPALNLVKGGGGAHFREKIVELAAKQFIVIVDDSKLCPALGPSFAIPVEIVPFCHEHTIKKISELPALDGCTPLLRMGTSSTPKPDGDKIAVSDNGNYIVDLYFELPMKDPREARAELDRTIGVVEHGLFIDMATTVIVAGSNGIHVADRKMGWW